MERSSISTLAALFRASHAQGKLLVLPNVWDVASARLVEAAGAEAIATSSAALAWSLGYQDGEHLPIHSLTSTIAAIAGAVSIPVTVDFELGYSVDPGQVAAAVLRLHGAGAVGVNLEDGSAPPELLVRKIRAIRDATAGRGTEVFLNARSDVYLRGLVPPSAAAEETLRRARLYAEAGCDGLFVPMVTATADIEALVRGTALPLNVMTVPGLPPVAELRRLGVRRLSAGVGLAEVAYGAAKRACAELLEKGTYESLFASGMTYPEMNGLFQRG